MKTIDNLWDRVKGAHKDEVKQINRYYAHHPRRGALSFIYEEVPMFYSGYAARFLTSLVFPGSMEEVSG